MGSWSVYCGISKITITEGDKCVLLPLRKNKYETGQYSPLTLPIFGEYDDYGGLTNIEINENTKLISEYYGCSIENFCSWFTNEITYSRGEVSESDFQNFSEIKNADFMWINREVYDFMSKNSAYAGHLDFGNPEILSLIGFESTGESGITRYTQKWIFEGKELYSDGTWAQGPNQESIFNFDSGYNRLSTYINIPEDKKWIGKKSMPQLWPYLKDKKVKELFLPILTGRHYDGFIEELLEDLGVEADYYITNLVNRTREPGSIINKYKARIRDFGDEFAELVTLAENLYPMSSVFEPCVLYITPQCGEFKRHQLLLEKFAEINKSKLDEEDEDDY